MAQPKSGGQVPLLLKDILLISYNIIRKNARINLITSVKSLNKPSQRMYRSTKIGGSILNNFAIIYRILRILEKTMEKDAVPIILNDTPFLAGRSRNSDI